MGLVKKKIGYRTIYLVWSYLAEGGWVRNMKGKHADRWSCVLGRSTASGSRAFAQNGSLAGCAGAQADRRKHAWECTIWHKDLCRVGKTAKQFRVTAGMAIWHSQGDLASKLEIQT